MMEYFHNPRCSKSREGLAILEEKGVQPTIVKYLDEVPSRESFVKLLQKLNLKPQDILRKGEKVFKEKLKGLDMNDDEWIDIMLENPKLIERPIFVVGNKAVVGRPPERVLELL